MTSTLTVTSQAQVLEAFTVLHTWSPEWRGSLILNVGLDAQGAAVSLASSVAGAVCLTVEPHADLLRAGLRRGACDFVVNTLDEALRAIKNEIRQGRPLAVGLQGDPARLLDELVERGVAPRLFTAAERFPLQARSLEKSGAQRLSLTPNAAGVLTAQEVLRDAALPWTIESFAFPQNTDLRTFESRALSILPAGDTLRRTWLGAAGRLFPRERTRVLWLSAEERSELSARAS